MDPVIEPVILANSKFSIDLLKVLCKDNTGNVLFSPLSISSALGPVVLGAGLKSNTADQMYKVCLKPLNSSIYNCHLMFINALKWIFYATFYKILYTDTLAKKERIMGPFLLAFLHSTAPLFYFICKHRPCIFSPIQGH